MKQLFVIGLLASLTLAGCDDTATATKSASSTKTVRAIDGSGVASGKFDTVDLNLFTSAVRLNKGEARHRVKNMLSGLAIAMADLEARNNVVFESDDTASTIRIERVWEWENSKKVDKGFKASARVYLRTKNVDKISEIVERLGEAEDIEMEEPTFLLSDSQVDKLHRSAFKAAVKRAKERFTNECETLGLQSDSFKVSSWAARYDNRRNAYDEGSSYTLSLQSARLASADKSDAVVIRGGKPKIFVTVRLLYTE